ncbi:MAG TPA: pitrilysin family protein [Terriglobia bacterium]|nr:pitrilysin family protein [Terriglobia bacterium]
MTKVKKEVLSNGLTIITEPMPAVRSVSVGIWLKTGSRHERESENGISHFIEHMLFKGTKNRSAEEIARSADSIGGHLDAFTAKETTGFSIKALDEHVPRAFEILSDLVKNPLLRPEDIAKESQVIQEEIKMVEDTPDDLVHEIFTGRYWKGHALGRPILGTRRTVAGFDRRELLSFFRRHYTPNIMLITAAGHLQHDRIVELVSREFGNAHSGQNMNDGHAPVPHPNIVLRRKKTLEQAHVCIGTPAYHQSHEKRYACFILNTVLGGGMSSRLFQNIREKRGLAYAVFSGISSFRDTGCLNVYAGTSTANARQVVDLTLEEFHQLKSKSLPDDEVQRAKDYLKGSMLLSLESTPSRMSNLARQEMIFGRHISLDEIAAGIDAVTTEDVRQVARELFVRDEIALTILGPLNGMKISRRDLAC